VIVTPDTVLRWQRRRFREYFRQRVMGMGIEEVLTAPQSPWQNPFAERLIGSIRREYLNHVVVFGERHLRRLLTAYFAYSHRARTHLLLDKDAPNGRPIEPPELGRVISIREVGGLQHRYIRRPA
jgi:transposase InsO family protein